MKKLTAIALIACLGMFGVGLVGCSGGKPGAPEIKKVEGELDKPENKEGDTQIVVD